MDRAAPMAARRRPVGKPPPARQAAAMPSPDSTPPSRLQLPPGPWATVLDALSARFPAIDRERWRDRFARGRVLDGDGNALAVDAVHRVGLEVRYFREVADEPPIDGDVRLVHVDAHLVVVDKPHFLPVMPAGRFVRETLLARLVALLGNPQLVPLHRIDRDTAGLVLFSADPGSRARYSALFAHRRVEKSYEALAPALRDLEFPHVRSSRLERGEPFFRMREVPGPPDSHSRIDVLQRGDGPWRYALVPITGRKHQLRVHMAALGAPIANDRLYPRVSPVADDPARPLRLLARKLAFADPLDGRAREFTSGRPL
jgi:tRNA pseudouridine32 synthase/23S rRNA pseudouridine746 synthase